MKKLLIIAVASSFLFISCAKVEPTPELQRSTSQVKPAPGLSASFTAKVFVITNTEKDWGVVEYRLTYTDPNFVVHTIPLAMGQSITLCLADNHVETNFAFTIVQKGYC